MRRFEFVDSKSSKFWQVTVQGATVLTQWGRIGTDGQTKSKDLGSSDKAQNEAEKQIRSKVKKGYVEVAVAGAPSPAGAGTGTAASATSSTSAAASASPAPTPSASPAPLAAPSSAEMPAWTMSEALKQAIGGLDPDPRATQLSRQLRPIMGSLKGALEKRSELPDEFVEAVAVLADDLSARLPVEQAAKAALYFRPEILLAFLRDHGPEYVRDVLEAMGQWEWPVTSYRVPLFRPRTPGDQVHEGWVWLAEAVQDDAAAREAILSKPFRPPVAPWPR